MAERFYRGNFLVIGSTTSLVLALTWGGVEAPWNSPRVLVPLVLGILGIGGFLLYEVKVSSHPLVGVHLEIIIALAKRIFFQVPLKVMNSRTGISGYIQTFLYAFYLSGTICELFDLRDT